MRCVLLLLCFIELKALMGGVLMDNVAHTTVFLYELASGLFTALELTRWKKCFLHMLQESVATPNNRGLLHAVSVAVLFYTTFFSK